MFKLRLPASQLSKWSSRNTDTGYMELQNTIGPAVKDRGYMKQSEFLEMCAWKSARTKSRCASNSEDLIEEVTSTALSARNEELRIHALSALCGVGWPTASVILHFCSNDRYPILDFRALWSLSIDKPPVYTFQFWWAYTNFCRELSDSSGLDMRQLDMALWKYSEEKQPANQQ